jgi:hypothetical protein
MSIWKPHSQEIFLTELEALAAEAGKAIGDFVFEVVDEIRDGISGRTISVPGSAPAPAGIASVATVSVADPAAEASIATELPANEFPTTQG